MRVRRTSRNKAVSQDAKDLCLSTNIDVFCSPKGEKMKKLAMVKSFLNDERGLETVEYAIIIGLVVAATLLLITQLGGWVAQRFRDLLTDLGEAPTA